MPLTASMPYERAVDIARSSGLLEQGSRERLVAYLAVWAPGLADRLLAQLVAAEPELVATAMLDMHFASDRPAYGYTGDHGEPDLVRVPARVPAQIAAMPALIEELVP